ncbi:MAG: DEAD/DEAH box helicase [Gemmatimonadota bacterium]|nr:DEAD/DEAH box helicase [Gemmatimonadota bacterium]
MADPLAAALGPGPRADCSAITRGLARSVAPAEAAVTSPHWLRPEQATQHRRAVLAIRRHRGVLLADPAGSGKTWIALATARCLAGETPVAVVAPAILHAQWSAVSRRTEVAMDFVSHESVSRGRLPGGPCRFVIIDESHRFRTATTRRYRTLAPWLVGRRGMLLSATPVVNRLDDLTHQLLLLLRDDTLESRGCASLRAALAAGRAPPSLGELVLRREGAEGLPAALHREVRTAPSAGLAALLRGVGRLRLSRDRGTAALLRLGLYRALASSPTAFQGALRRHLRLLDHAASALNAGRRVNRAALRTLVGDDPDQLLMWGVLADADGEIDLDPGEAPAVAALLAAAREAGGTSRGSGCLRELRTLLADRAVTVVFTTSRDTLAWLRDQLAGLVPAWVTGDEAGIGATRMPRDTVLRWFGPAATPLPGLRTPHLLLATDVAAEGLDLQRAHRVVHFDLPWTDVRLEQRDGRARRIGASARSVEIITFLPHRMLEARIRQLERLRDKRALRSLAGLDHRSQWLFGWRAALARWAGAGPAVAGFTVVHATDPGWLVGVALATHDGSAAPATLIWFAEDGSDTDDPEQTVPRFLAAAGAPPSTADLDWHRLLPRLARRARRLLGEAAGAGWCRVPGRAIERAVARRLEQLARGAAARRDQATLRELESLLDTVRGGLSAGEAFAVERAARLRDGNLLSALRELPGRPATVGPPRPLITGIVRVATFPSCEESAPCSSISMEP